MAACSKREDGGGKQSHLRSTFKIVFVVVCLGLAAFALFLQSAKRRAHAMQCGSNLTSVSYSARLYSNDHNDTFASSFVEMSNEVITAKVLICPADSDRKAAAKWNKLNAIPWSALTTNDVTYEWIARGQQDTNANQILLRCPIHGFTAHADSRVLDRDGTTAPNGKRGYR